MWRAHSRHVTLSVDESSAFEDICTAESDDIPAVGVDFEEEKHAANQES